MMDLSSGRGTSTSGGSEGREVGLEAGRGGGGREGGRVRKE